MSFSLHVLTLPVPTPSTIVHIMPDLCSALETFMQSRLGRHCHVHMKSTMLMPRSSLIPCQLIKTSQVHAQLKVLTGELLLSRHGMGSCSRLGRYCRLVCSSSEGH